MIVLTVASTKFVSIARNLATYSKLIPDDIYSISGNLVIAKNGVKTNAWSYSAYMDQ